MNRKIKIADVQWVDGGESIQVHTVRYQDSEPFGGIFAVTELDNCIFSKPDGKTYLHVLCSVGTGADDEDELLEFELLEPVATAIGITGGANVARRIVWEKAKN